MESQTQEATSAQTDSPIDEKQRKRQEKEKKELARLYKEKAKKKPKFYLWYMMLILTLIYIVDEVSTSLPNNLKPQINMALVTWPWAQAQNPAVSLETLVDQTFHYTETTAIVPIQEAINAGLSTFNLIGMLGNIMLILCLFYRPLADRYGRRVFLFLNALGLALSLFILFTAQNLWVYILGFFLLRFFVTPDQQVTYIFEISPAKKRGTIFATIKGFSLLGLLLIPLLRRIFMNDEMAVGSYRYIFLTLAIAAFVVSFLALFFSRETDTFLDERISYLEMTPEQREAAAKKADASSAQGGLFSALRYTLKNKQLRWISIATAIAEVAYFPVNNYQDLMTSGFLGQGAMDQAAVTSAMVFMPLTCAAINFAYGFLTDKVGRKKTSVCLLSTSAVCFVLFFLGMYFGWPTWLIGLLVGFAVGADWANSDVLSLIAAESCPTNLRASISSSWSLFYGFGMILSFLGGTLIPRLAGTQYSSLCYFLMAVPGWTISLILLSTKVRETKGLEISSEAGKSALDE